MEFKEGDKVDIKIEREIKIGFVVIIENKFEGLIYKNEVFRVLKKNQKITAYIKKVREDGKIDLSLTPQGFKNSIDHYCEFITNQLKLKGSIRLSDKSSPEEIRSKLKMSKKAFKKSIGVLYKRKKIKIGKNQIELIR